MRNLSLLQELIHVQGNPDVKPSILHESNITIDTSNDRSLLLTQSGIILVYCDERSEHSIDANPPGESHFGWFGLDFIEELGTLVCVSHSGCICTVKELSPGCWSSEQEGIIEDGIITAIWSPARDKLLIVTNNNTMLTMTNTWDVLQEVCLEEIQSKSSCTLSWREDGQYFALYTTDASDGVARVRIYDKDLQLQSIGRTVADGIGGTISGLLPALAYGSSFNLVAVAQRRTHTKLQIVLFEQNGLKHGEFEIVTPTLPPAFDEWTVVSMYWDLPALLLVVTLHPISKDKTSEDIAMELKVGIVQIYCRSNYHWYLKQQWHAEGSPSCVGFDREKVGRLYISSWLDSCLMLRTIDTVWDTICSATRDSSTAVVDGCNVLLTPLGFKTVPPPMSTHKLSMPSVPHHITFWNRSPSNASFTQPPEEVWIMACLCDLDILRIWFGDMHGTPTRSIDINVRDIQNIRKPEELVYYRSIHITEDVTKTCLNIFIVGQQVGVVKVGVGVGVESADTCLGNAKTGRTIGCMTYSCSGSDLLTHIVVHSISGEIVQSQRTLLPMLRSITRVTQWADDYKSVAVGVKEGTNSSTDLISEKFFYVWKLTLQGLTCGWSCDHLVSKEFSFPENCTHFSVLRFPSSTDGSDDNGIDKHICIGSVADKNKIYCGDMLIASGASSYCINSSMQLLLYCTVGTRPHLHFCSLVALAAIDPLQYENECELPIECAEPRPVERGARLVASIPTESKVIIQLPRGNIEAFEPRPLILMHARDLLESNKYYDCLILLRRQRVDLNFIIDYNPTHFLRNIGSLLESVMTKSSWDVLSLFISSIASIDTIASKYPFFPLLVMSDGKNVAKINEPQDSSSISELFSKYGKVNVVCKAIRDVLFKYLMTDACVDSALVSPLLCTYSKEYPPKLGKSLNLIKYVAGKSSGYFAIQKCVGGLDDFDFSLSSFDVTKELIELDNPGIRNISSKSLSGVKVQSALKYLTFLVDGQLIFNAALSECDFEMARIVARHCQMDPKQYNPLIGQFESIGCINSDFRYLDFSPYYDGLMRFRVNIHLTSYMDAVKFGLKALEDLLICLVSVAQSLSSETKIEDSLLVTRIKELAVSQLCDDISRAVSEHDLFSYTFPKLSAIVFSIPSEYLQSAEKALNTEKQNDGLRTLVNVVSLVPNLLSRIRILYAKKCMSDMNYKEAISAYLSACPPDPHGAVRAARLAGSWSTAISIAGKYYQLSRFTNYPTELISEDGENATDDLNPHFVAQELVSAFREGLEQGQAELEGCFGSTNKDKAEFESKDRAVEAAQICLSYLNDVEGAISILLLARRWNEAVNAAIIKQRFDLLHDEISNAIKEMAQTMIAEMELRIRVYSDLIQELSVIWSNPEMRLEQVASSEPALMATLNGNEESNTEADESKSEFSTASRYTTGSNVSFRSTNSSASGTSCVSVLSRLSSASTASTQSQFSIGGLDHSLLSRGTATYVQKEKLTDRQRKKKERKATRSRGEGKDTWGLRRECAICEEVWKLADVDYVVLEVSRICEALLLIGTIDLESCSVLASKLQLATDTYVRHICSIEPPLAPLYPIEWLEKRNMAVIQKFQKACSFTSDNLGGSKQQSSISSTEVLNLVERGITIWDAAKLVSLSTDASSKK